MKKWCLSCVIRGFQMEAAAWSPCSLIRRPRAWTLTPAVLARLRAAEPSCCCWGRRWCGTLSSWLPGIYSNRVKAYVHPKSCPPELTAALLRCLQYVNGYNWCTCAMGYDQEQRQRHVGDPALRRHGGSLKAYYEAKEACLMATARCQLYDVSGKGQVTEIVKGSVSHLQGLRARGGMRRQWSWTLTSVTMYQCCFVPCK